MTDGATMHVMSAGHHLYALTVSLDFARDSARLCEDALAIEGRTHLATNMSSVISDLGRIQRRLTDLRQVHDGPGSSKG